MPYENITFAKSEGIAELVMNRPDVLNALGFEMLNEMVDAVVHCYRDEDVRALILTGTGPAFSAGGDVKAMHRILDDDPSVFFRRLVLLLNGLISSLQRLPKPVVGAINGVAAGAGFSCALACDYVLASDQARFVSAYTGIGITPDGGLTYWLPRLIGTKRAMELILTNRTLDASAALEMGMVNRIVPAGQLMEEARREARALAQGPTRAFGGAKMLVNFSGGESLETQLELERQTIAEVSGTGDFREGVTAFVEKRAPVFRGR